MDHKSIRAAGQGLESLVSPDSPRRGRNRFISMKITNTCCQVTIIIFTNQDLEIRGFLEWSLIVNQHTTQAFQSNQSDSFVLLVVKNSHYVSRELKMLNNYLYGLGRKLVSHWKVLSLFRNLNFISPYRVKYEV